MSKIPTYTSTPNRTFKPSGRPRIRDPKMADVLISPIDISEKQVKEPKEKLNKLRHSLEGRTSGSSDNSESEEYNSDSSLNDIKKCVKTPPKTIINTSPKKIETKSKSDNNNSLSWILIPSVIVLILGSIFIHANNDITNSTKLYTNEDFANDFKNQNKDLWYSVEGAISDIENLNRISVYMFLYTDNSKEVLDEIIDKITDYYNCKLKGKSSLVRVDIEGKKLADDNFTEDYGRILTTYKKELEEKGILVVRNLENVPTASAQAFHSICDQYGPLVEKSFIILTMKVDRIPDNPSSFCEDKLRKQWVSLEDDKFYPLYTRLSNVIMGINPEDS